MASHIARTTTSASDVSMEAAVGAAGVHRERIGFAARNVPDPSALDAIVEHLRTGEAIAFKEGTALRLDHSVDTPNGHEASAPAPPTGGRA